MKQKHYSFFTIFFIIALLILTSAAWRDYVRTNIIDTETSSGNR